MENLREIIKSVTSDQHNFYFEFSLLAEISTQRTILPACNSVNDLCGVDITISDPFSGKSTCTVLVKVGADHVQFKSTQTQ